MSRAEGKWEERAAEPGPAGRGRDRNDAAAHHILVVEDDADGRTALCALLESYGYTVTSAANGREAVARARSESPDLILMDLMMPVMDGLEAAHRIRRSEDHADTVIVCVTATDAVSGGAVETRFDDWVRKPIDLAGFRRRLRTWLGRNGTPA